MAHIIKMIIDKDKHPQNETPTFRCNKCGSQKIFLQAIANPNTNEIIYIDDKDCFCEDCKEQTEVVVEIPKKIKK